MVIPPDESSDGSDDGLGNKDHAFKNVNNIGKDTLTLKGKLMIHPRQNFLIETDVKDR